MNHYYTHFGRFFRSGRWLLFLFLVVQCGKPEPEQEANRLFVEAHEHIKKAQELKYQDPKKSSAHFQEASDNIDIIIERFSGTRIAVDVTQNHTLIGEMTIGELRKTAPLLKKRANALNDFHSLTLYLIDRISDLHLQSETRLSYASRLYEMGNHSLSTQIIDDVNHQMNRHWNREVTDPVYVKIASVYARQKKWGPATEILEHIQDSELLYQALSSIINEEFIQDPSFEASRIQLFLKYLTPANQIRIIHQICVELLQMEDNKKAISWLSHLPPSSDPLDSLDYVEKLIALASLFAQYGENDSSLKVIQLIDRTDDDYTEFAKREVIKAWVKRSDLDRAKELLSKMEHEYFIATSLAGIAVEKASRGHVSDALATLEPIPDEGVEKTGAKIEIANILSRFEDYERADSLLNIAFDLTKSLPSPVDRSLFLVRMADIYHFGNKNSEAAEMLDFAERDSRKISDSRNINLILKEISTMWLILGRPDRIMDLAVYFQMDHPSFREPFLELLERMIDNNYHDLARSTALLTEEPHRFLYLLLFRYLEKNKFEEAAFLIEHIRNYYLRTKALSALTLELKRSGQKTESEKTADSALLHLQRIRDRELAEEAFLDMSMAFSSGGFSMNENRRLLSQNQLNQLIIKK